MIFKKLFTITSIHQYFTSGQCSDIQLEPTADCSTLLKDYRMLFKQEDVSIYSVLQPNSDIKLPVLLSALNFYVFITGNEFYNYTKYPINTKSSTEDISNTNKTSNNKSNSSTLLFNSINSNTDTSSFTVSETAKPSPFSFQNRKLFGIISIIPPPVFCNYVLTLEAVAIKWRYYIVADKSIKNVEVKEKAKDSSVDVSEIITFKNITDTIQTDPDINIYDAVKKSFPDTGVFIYESVKEVLFVQKPGKIIQLWNTTDLSHEAVLMDNLPIPSSQDNDNGQKIIYALSKNNNF